MCNGGVFLPAVFENTTSDREEETVTVERSSFEKYLSMRKNTYILMATAAVIVLLLVIWVLKPISWEDFISDMLFWEPFVLFFILWQCQLHLSERKQAVIREATDQVAREFAMQCKDPGLWDDKQCRASLLFEPQVNAFYLERSIPHRIFTLEKQGATLQCSHVSYGVLSKRVKKVGKRYVSQGRHATIYVMSEGLLFRCHFPCCFSDSWLLLPKKWGRHLEKITPVRFFLTDLAGKPVPPNFSLFKNEGDTLWIYSTAGSVQDANAAVLEEGTFVEKCYALLREKPYSLMSFTGNNMYVYIPFEWKMTSAKELQECVAAYRANWELVRKIVFEDVMPRHYARQFAAMNFE